MSYENQLSLKDGRIFLYTRNGKPTFHARLKIDGRKGYIVQSTRCKNRGDAIRYAEELYDDLRYKVRHGLEVKKHTFKTLWHRWHDDNISRLSEHRRKYIVGTANRYLLPFFGDIPIEQLNDAKIEQYWTWRINFWASPDGVAKINDARKSRTTGKRPYKQKLGNVAKIPAQKSLQMEQSVLRQIMNWANRIGILNRLPEIKCPKLNNQSGINRRPAFDLKEWQTLYRFLRIWVVDDHIIDRKRKSNKFANSRQLWQREMIRNYILFMGTSGLRPNEAHQLKWSDIENITDINSNNQILLHISPTTKTGYRQCIPLKTARRYLERVKKISEYVDLNDYVFCNPEGERIDGYGKTFKSILTQCGLLKDRHQKTRTIYSLRHTYATFRILYGNANIEDLAQNMGTSPTQIYNHYRHISVLQKSHEHGGILHPEKSRKGLTF